MRGELRRRVETKREERVNEERVGCECWVILAFGEMKNITPGSKC